MERSGLIAAIRRPSSAAVAGLVFAGIFGFALALIHGALPGQQEAIETWTSEPGRRSAVSLAITLLPFAGIAFLWFIAVTRALLGAREDRFFETVYLGSGLVFVASMFTAAAAIKAVLALDTAADPLSPDTVAFAWAFASAVLGGFGAKMAAVFNFSAASAGVRAGTLPRWLAILGFLTGLSLLVIPPLPNLAQFLFPAWVAAVSVLILVRRPRTAPTATTSHPSPGVVG